MENSSHPAPSDPGDHASRLKERFRREADAFNFDALITGVSTLEKHPESVEEASSSSTALMPPSPIGDGLMRYPAPATAIVPATEIPVPRRKGRLGLQLGILGVAFLAGVGITVSMIHSNATVPAANTSHPPAIATTPGNTATSGTSASSTGNPTSEHSSVSAGIDTSPTNTTAAVPKPHKHSHSAHKPTNNTERPPQVAQVIHHSHSATTHPHPAQASHHSAPKDNSDPTYDKGVDKILDQLPGQE